MLSRSFSPLERRATFSIALLYGVRMLGLFMVLPVLALAATEYRGYTVLLLGATLGVYGLTQAVLQIPLSLLSDRVGRRPVIIAGLSIFIAGSLVAAYSDSLVGLFLGRALQGMGAIAGTLMAMVTDFTEEKNRSTAMAVIGGTIGVSFMVAMTIGSPVVGLFGLSGIFFLSALLGVLGITIVVLLLPTKHLMMENWETKSDTAVMLGLLKDPNLMRLNASIFVLHFVLMASFVVVPSLFVNELHIPAGQHGWFYLALLGGGFIVMLPILVLIEKREQHKRGVLGAILCMALSMASLSFLPWGVWLTPLVLLFFFAAFNLLEASLPAWMSKVCPAGCRGSAMGIYSTSQFLGTFFGGFFGGICAANVGVQGVFILIAMTLCFWLVLAMGLKAPRPLRTYVLHRGDISHQEFGKRLLNIVGVEDILAVEGEALVYARVDCQIINLTTIEPYFNRVTTGE